MADCFDARCTCLQSSGAQNERFPRRPAWNADSRGGTFGTASVHPPRNEETVCERALIAKYHHHRQKNRGWEAFCTVCVGGFMVKLNTCLKHAAPLWMLNIQATLKSLILHLKKSVAGSFKIYNDIEMVAHDLWASIFFLSDVTPPPR